MLFLLYCMSFVIFWGAVLCFVMRCFGFCCCACFAVFLVIAGVVGWHGSRRQGEKLFFAQYKFYAAFEFLGMAHRVSRCQKEPQELSVSRLHHREVLSRLGGRCNQWPSMALTNGLWCPHPGGLQTSMVPLAYGGVGRADYERDLSHGFVDP